MPLSKRADRILNWALGTFSAIGLLNFWWKYAHGDPATVKAWQIFRRMIWPF